MLSQQGWIDTICHANWKLTYKSYQSSCDDTWRNKPVPVLGRLTAETVTSLYQEWRCDHRSRSLPMWLISSSHYPELSGCPSGYLCCARPTKVRTSNDLLVTFAGLYQTAHASSPPSLMAQFQQQKYNQRQHWPAVCVKNTVFMRVRPASVRVIVRGNWVK